MHRMHLRGYVARAFTFTKLFAPDYSRISVSHSCGPDGVIMKLRLATAVAPRQVSASVDVSGVEGPVVDPQWRSADCSRDLFNHP